MPRPGWSASKGSWPRRGRWRPCGRSRPRGTPAPAGRVLLAGSRALAGLRDASGPVRVAFVDGHVDVYDGHSSPTGEAADMPMSVALGLGPARWVQAAGGPSAVAAATSRWARATPRRPRTSRGCGPACSRRSRCWGPGAARRGPGRGRRPRRARLGRDRGRFSSTSIRRARRTGDAGHRLPDARRAGVGRARGAAGASWAPPAPPWPGLSLGCLNPEKDPGGA